MERKRFYETEVDGRKAVADTATGVIHFDAVMRNDALVPHTDVIVMKGERLPGPGERKCWNCGLRWILEAGQEDVCPKCRRPNVIPGSSPPKVEIVLPRRNYRDESPSETLKRSRKIIRQIKTPAAPELTVGDLSYSTRYANKDYMQHVDAMKRGLSVGDLSVVTNRKGDVCSGRVYKGSDAAYCPRPPTSSTEQMRVERAAEMQAKQDEVRKMEQMIFDLRREREMRSEARSRGISF